MNSDNNFNLGRHEALIERLAIGQEQLVADVGQIKRTLDEERGEHRVKSALWGFSGGALVAVVASFLKAKLGLHS